jgi:aromatic-L-amino-acid decarboxylase
MKPRQKAKNLMILLGTFSSLLCPVNTILLSIFASKCPPGITHWQHPSFFAYFPTANTFEGVLADLLSSSVSNPGFNWACSPACTELEAIVMDWAAKLFGLDPTFHVESNVGGGVILVRTPSFSVASTPGSHLTP